MPDLGDFKQKSKLYHYAAKVTRVYDGDTITVDIDLGMGLWRNGQTIRFWKVNTPEVRGASRSEGLAVRDFVRDLVLGKTILLRTILDKRGVDRTGKFGRLLGEILVADDEGNVINVNDLLLEKGFGLPVNEEGTTLTPAAMPLPAGRLPDEIDCPYCGEERDVDDGVVERCPNCLDGPYRLG
jgi:micrococcal nuclease